MPKFELIETVTLDKQNSYIRSSKLPEMVHLDDSAYAVMEDFSTMHPHAISPTLSMDQALDEMKIHGVHLLLIKNSDHAVIGLISTEDVLGSKPIQLLQERRMHRSKITVEMLMTPIKKIPAFRRKSMQYAKVGNVVETLTKHNQHFAFVIDEEHESDHYCLCGIFSTWQISRQLHQGITDPLDSAHSVSELQHRKKD